MKRFQRLVELRGLREETFAMAMAKKVSLLNAIGEEIHELDRQTESERLLARESLALGTGMPSQLVEDFFRGQVWRRRRLEEKKSMAQVEVHTARQTWIAARRLTQQAEKLAEKAALAQNKLDRRQEMKELDMIGIINTRIS